MMCMDVYDVCEGGAWLLKGGEKVERCCMQHVQERDGNVNARNDEPMEPSDVKSLLPPVGDQTLGLHI